MSRAKRLSSSAFQTQTISSMSLPAAAYNPGASACLLPVVHCILQPQRADGRVYPHPCAVAVPAACSKEANGCSTAARGDSTILQLCGTKQNHLQQPLQAPGLPLAPAGLPITACPCPAPRTISPTPRQQLRRTWLAARSRWVARHGAAAVQVGAPVAKDGGLNGGHLVMVGNNE